MTEKTDTIAEQFMVSPYSVLDSRTSAWKERKKGWKDRLGESTFVRMGMPYDTLAMRYPDLYTQSTEDRKRLGLSFEQWLKEHAADKVSKEELEGAVTASLDPVLAELAYHWFTPMKGSKIFDPFAGGFYEGAVASECGHIFTGVDIRQSQVDSNNERCIHKDWRAVYICDNCINVNSHLGYATQDLMLTCPPYYNLAQYDDVTQEQTYDEYLGMMDKALQLSVQCLKKNRFAVVVISDVRDGNGCYRDLPGDIIRIMQSAGCHLWNELILINNDASAKLRIRSYMRSRKTVRTHQKVLVFFNGRPSTIPKLFPQIQKPC